MQNLINKYKKIRKKQFLKSSFNDKYAFVGIGNHSLNNLYPVLDYLKVDLKYIVTKSEETVKTINDNYKNIKGTTNLDKVLNDKSINGIFVSATPSAHFELAEKILKADKNLFIEKPPCLTLEELDKLQEAEKHSKGNAFIGLQKRFAPVFSQLYSKVKSKKVNYYKLEYYSGHYPEGDTLTDLFIHPLDIACYMFGKPEIELIRKIKCNKGVETILLELKHPENIYGHLELSTDFWWARGNEKITVNTEKQIFYSDGINSLKYIDKPKSLMNVPLEKVKSPVLSEHYLYQKNNFLPVREHNDLYAAGYFKEIESFLNVCEHGGDNISTIESVRPVFELIDNIRKK